MSLRSLRTLKTKEIEKKSRRQIPLDRNKFFLYIGVLSMIILVILVISYFFILPQKEQPEIFNKEKILKIANNEKIVQDFISNNPRYKVKVVLLTEENLTELSENFPALYSDLPKENFYQVEYISGDSGIFVIIDTKNLEVVKYFKVHSIGLGSMQI